MPEDLMSHEDEEILLGFAKDRIETLAQECAGCVEVGFLSLDTNEHPFITAERTGTKPMFERIVKGAENNPEIMRMVRARAEKILESNAGSDETPEA